MFEETYKLQDGKAHCAECGSVPAFRPRVHVMNTESNTRDQYLLDLPHMCDKCIQKRGFTRHNILVPKAEGENFTEACSDFMSKIPDWVKRFQERQLKELVDQGMPEQEARDFLGVK